MEITYKALEYEDIPALTPIMKASFDEDTKMHTELLQDGPHGYDTGELLEKMLMIQNSVSRVILCGSRMIGGYTVQWDKDIFTLALIFLDPMYASRGTGFAVWQDIEREFAQAKTWIVETPAYSARNHHFYRKCGFHVFKSFSYPDGAKSLFFIKHIQTAPVHIRQYQEERDYPHILESCKKEHWEKFYTVKKEAYKQALKQSVTYAAYEGEHYCGYIRCITDGIFTIYCCEIIVDDIYKRRGIGRALIETVREQYPACCMDVLSDNDDFYLSGGFLRLCNGMRKP